MYGFSPPLLPLPACLPIIFYHFLSFAIICYHLIPVFMLDPAVLCQTFVPRGACRGQSPCTTAVPWPCCCGSTLHQQSPMRVQWPNPLRPASVYCAAASMHAPSGECHPLCSPVPSLTPRHSCLSVFCPPPPMPPLPPLLPPPLTLPPQPLLLGPFSVLRGGSFKAALRQASF